jgi:hypothetical protein
MSETTKKTTDQIVLELLQKVDSKKKQIGEAERPAWQTNCSFGYNTDSNSRINIQTIRELEQLVETHAFLVNKTKSFSESVKSLKLGDVKVEFKHLGYTFNQWESDIKTRIDQLQIKIKRDELLTLEARVNALVSPEQRRAIELEKLVAELK